LHEGWDDSLEMFVHRYLWVEADIRVYLKQLCVNEATQDKFLAQGRRCVMLLDVQDNPDDFELDEIESTMADAAKSPEMHNLPLPPAMWSIGDTVDKV
jgi:hypothetical protein